MTKKFPRIITLILPIILFVFLGLFLIINNVSAECYMVYPYGNYKPPPSPATCYNSLPEYTTSWDSYLRYFSMSNCHCEGSKPVFDKVCSFNVYYWPWEETYNNLPLYYNQCPVCGHGYYQYYFDYIYVSPADPHILKDALTFSQEQVISDLGISEQDYWQGLTTQSYSCAKGTKELPDPAYPDSTYTVSTYTCTYQPCQWPLTCQEKCQKDLQRNGQCLDKPDSAIGYPLALKIEGQYSDCNTGQSCYCQNNKPVVEIGYPKLELDATYSSHFKKIFEIPEQEIISEYDVWDSSTNVSYLTCQAYISDKDPEDLKKIKNYPPDFEILAGWTIMGNFNSLGKIDKTRIKCEFNDKGSVTCRAYLSKDIADKIERGMLLKCKVTPKDPYQQGEAKISNTLAVADHLYYFFRTKSGWGNATEQYLSFLNLSALTNNYREIKDRTQRIGKSYWYNKDISLGLVVPRSKKPVYIEEQDDRYIFQFREVAIKAGAVYNPRKDDKIIEIDAYPAFDSVTGLLTVQGGAVKTHPLLISDYIYLGGQSNDLSTLAHEMGHSSKDSRLCDEYTKSAWKKKDDHDRFINREIRNLDKGCPNPFPPCCEGVGFCGSANHCWGMPYSNENTSEPNWDQEKFKGDVFFSIMSGKPVYISVDKEKDVIVKGNIYPKEAQCPLRNCK